MSLETRDSADRRRILFTIARGDVFGGSSLHVLSLADRLNREGWRTRILVGGDETMEVPRRFAARGLDFRCVGPMGGRLHPWNDLRSILAIRREIRSFRPDLLSLHASKAGGLGRIASIGTGVDVIYTPHCWSFVDGFPRAGLYQGIERLLAPLARRIVTVSDDERRFGLERGVGRAGQLVRLHNGVEDAFGSDAIVRSDPEKVRIVMVGRFETQKDQHLLVEALAGLRDLPWELTLVGDGPLRIRCRDRVEAEGLGDRVHFLGYSDRVEELLAAHDLFVLASRWEGLPRSILEAMSASLPVIATDVGGCREAIVDGVTGRLVAPGDRSELRQALHDLIADPERLRAMGNAGRTRFLEQFTFEKMFDRYSELYESILPASAAGEAGPPIAPSSMKDLAVLIPSYNDTPALRRTLESIREDDPSFTVYVVDDGSREPVTIDPGAYEFPVRVLRLEKNGGIVKALNAGLEAIRRAGFRFVARLDAADLNRPGRFRSQYDRLRGEPGLSMVGANVVFHEESTGEEDFTTKLPLTSEETRRWIVFRNSFIHPAVMIRMSILEDAGFYDPRHRHIEDYVLFSRILRRGRGVNLEVALVDCFHRASGISRKHHRAQMLAGFRYKLLEEPRPLDPLWYAFLLKRLASILVPHGTRTVVKKALGFAHSSREIERRDEREQPAVGEA